jgi:TRAP-type C4-dicarboxylate transport system permease small subunit
MDTAAFPETGRINIIGRIAGFFEKVSLATLAAIATLVFAQIVLRNFFSLAYASLDELARFAHISLVFLLVPLLFREGLHINVDLLTRQVPPAARRVLAALAALLTALYSAVFLVSEYQFMMKNGSVPTPALGIPNWFFFAGAYVGMALLLVTACEQFFAQAKKRP